jgi:hypothetical protein
MMILLIIITALIAAFNPCSLAVAVMSISSLLGKGKHPRHAAFHTLMFAAGILIATLAAFYASTAVWVLLPINLVGYIGLLIATIIACFGLLEIKDYFWYGKGLSFSLSQNSEQRIHTWTKQHHSGFRGLLLGIYTALRLGHYTLILLLGVSLLSYLARNFDMSLGVIWAVVYTLPVISMGIMVWLGVDAHSITTWKEQTKHTMRLSIGLLYVLIGWLLLAFMAGGLKLG